MAVYLVKTPDGKERLVEAANRASARNHVAKSALEVAVAKQADLFRVAKAGGEIETAGEVVAEPAAAEPQAGTQGEGGGDAEPGAEEPPVAQPKKAK